MLSSNVDSVWGGGGGFGWGSSAGGFGDFGGGYGGLGDIGRNSSGGYDASYGGDIFGAYPPNMNDPFDTGSLWERGLGIGLDALNYGLSGGVLGGSKSGGGGSVLPTISGDGTNLFGSNQYGTYPTVGSGGMTNLSGAGTPGMTSTPGTIGQQGQLFTGSSGSPLTPYGPSLNSQFYYGSTYSPNFTDAFENFLKSNIGMGVTPFNAQSILPSSGGTTGAGTLTAPNNQMLQNLFQAFTSGNYSGVGGLDTLASMSKTGNPIDQTPAWQAMVDSMQRQIGQGAANLKEQFNVGGGLVGSPYGTAMTDYYTQTGKDLNAQLLAAQTGALESAAGRQLTAGQSLAGMNEQLGSLFQGLDQASIDRLYQEFQRTSPQANPLLNAMYGISTTFPPYMAKESGLTGLGATIGNIGAIGSMLGGGMTAAGATSGTLGTLAAILSGLCWISRAIFGDDNYRVPHIRRFLVRYGAKDPSGEGMKLLRWYVNNGPAIAFLIKLDPRIGEMFRPTFQTFYELGKAGVV